MSLSSCHFVADGEALRAHSLRLSLNLRGCPFCRRCGTLNRHSFLYGNALDSPNGRELRGQRFLCCPRGRRGGCGRTFPVFLAGVSLDDISNDNTALPPANRCLGEGCLWKPQRAFCPGYLLSFTGPFTRPARWTALAASRPPAAAGQRPAPPALANRGASEGRFSRRLMSAGCLSRVLPVASDENGLAGGARLRRGQITPCAVPCSVTGFGRQHHLPMRLRARPPPLCTASKQKPSCPVSEAPLSGRGRFLPA